MTTGLLIAASHRLDGIVAATFERAPGCHVVRRCVDLADLLAAAASGLAEAAVVTADLRGLDRSALGQLRDADVALLGVFAPGDEDQERQLRQLGLCTVVAADADLDVVAAAVEALVRQRAEAASASPPLALAGATGPGADAEAGEGEAGHVGGEEGEGAHRLFAVWGPTGAPGRTTVAVNLAVELARRGSSCLLVDADTYGSAVAQALSLLDEAPGLAAAARASEQGRLDLPVLAKVATEVVPGLRVLTGLPKPERWPELRQPALQHVLQLGRRLCRFTVVDCGFSLEDDEELSYDTRAPRRNATTLVALAQADEVIAVGAADPVGLQRLVRGLQDLADVAPEPPRVVVNKLRASAVGSRPERQVRDALARFAGIQQPWFVPDDRAGLDAAMLAGRSLAEHVPGSPARKALAALAAELAGGDAVQTRSRRAGRLTRWARA